MTTPEREEQFDEMNHALVSLFGVHQTGDPDDVVRSAFESILKTYTERISATAEARGEARGREEATPTGNE